MHTKCQSTSTSKQLYGSIVTKRCYMEFLIPIGIKHHPDRFNVSKFLHVKAFFALLVSMTRVYTALTPLLRSSE